MKVKRSTRVAWRRIEDEVVVVSSDQNNLTILNDTAARVWELLEGTRSLDQLTDAIHLEFEVSREVARADVGKFVGELQTRGLILPGEG